MVPPTLPDGGPQGKPLQPMPWRVPRRSVRPATSIRPVPPV